MGVLAAEFNANRTGTRWKKRTYEFFMRAHIGEGSILPPLAFTTVAKEP